MTTIPRRTGGETKRALGARILAARRRAGKSQESVAREAGVSQAAVSHYGRGLREPTFTLLVRIADAVGLDLAELTEVVRNGGSRVNGAQGD